MSESKTPWVVMGDTAIAINKPLLPMPEIPNSFEELRTLMSGWGVSGVSLDPVPEILMNRTAYGIVHQEMQSLGMMQRMENGIRNSVLDMMRFTHDPYLPRIRKQFRFPRSKKRRIRNKWAKDPRNWKEVPVAMKFKTMKARPCHEVDLAYLQLATAHRTLFSEEELVKRFL